VLLFGHLIIFQELLVKFYTKINVFNTLLSMMMFFASSSALADYGDTDCYARIKGNIATLAGCDFKTIPSGIFSGNREAVTEMRLVNLRYLKSLPTDFFTGFTHLKKLVVSTVRFDFQYLNPILSQIEELSLYCETEFYHQMGSYSLRDAKNLMNLEISTNSYGSDDDLLRILFRVDSLKNLKLIELRDFNMDSILTKRHLQSRLPHLEIHYPLILDSIILETKPDGTDVIGYCALEEEDPKRPTQPGEYVTPACPWKF
jgi:hypothetical protein